MSSLSVDSLQIKLFSGFPDSPYVPDFPKVPDALDFPDLPGFPHFQDVPKSPHFLDFPNSPDSPRMFPDVPDVLTLLCLTFLLVLRHPI